MWKVNSIYHNVNPIASLCIKVLKIRHINNDRVKLQVRYINKRTGALQYTARGRDGFIDNITIPKSKYKLWKNCETKEY